MAAVDGLSDRPVLLVDFVLNWREGRDEPMKLIRFRSDRFDPLAFVPEAGDPLAALRSWVGQLVDASGADCLPNRELREGRFARFPSLAEYEARVLMAKSARGG